MPSFAAAATIARRADDVFATLADGTTLAGWGAPLTSGAISVDHIGGPPTGEGAAFRVLERLDSGAIANYELNVACCERPYTLTLRAPHAFDRTFTCEEVGEATRVVEVRTYPDRPRRLVARLFAANLDDRPAEEAIRDELERLGALLAKASPPRRAAVAAFSG